MNPREQGLLLLTGYLGDPESEPLTVPQLRKLAQLARGMERPLQEHEMTAEDLVKIGCSRPLAQRVVYLLSREKQLQRYLQKGYDCGCYPITRLDARYPHRLRNVLQLDAPAVLWAKGDSTLLQTRSVSAVGSRNLLKENLKFAREVGKQAALQGYTLVSGNARGADRAAQDSCLEHGGNVICVVADMLKTQDPGENILYISEEGFDLPFSAQRALQRNRVIHSMSEKTFVAQCTMEKGGTWSGTCNNLRNNWSQVICFDDGTDACRELECRGAVLVDCEKLSDICSIQPKAMNFIDPCL